LTTALAEQPLAASREVPAAAAPEGKLLRSGKVHVKKISTWHDLEALRPAWNDVLSNSAHPTIFSTPEWLGAWWKAFAHGGELCALAFMNSGNEMIGLAPLYLEKFEGPFSLPLRCLRFAGDGSEDSDNLNLVVRRGHEDACARSMLNWLAADSSWDVCELNTLPVHSSSLDPLTVGLHERGWTFRRLERPNLSIALPDTWEKYLDHIPKKEKTKIKSRTRKLEKHFQMDFHECNDAAGLSKNLDILFDLHQKRWKLRGTPGTFSSPCRREFYRYMAAAFLEKGWLGFRILKLNGKPVAAQFGFRYGHTYYGLQEGFDPELSDLNVGYVLRAYMMKSLIESGVRKYDFLAGEDPYKKRWGAVSGNYVDLHFARPFARGAFHLHISRTRSAVRNWLRATLPTPTIDRLRRAYRAVSSGPAASDAPAFHGARAFLAPAE